MKVTVSIPDDVFAEAEALAKRLKSSRSELFSRALGEFIGHHAPDRVTNLMDEVVDQIGDEPDTFTAAAARRVLKKVEWSLDRRKFGGPFWVSQPARFPAAAGQLSSCNATRSIVAESAP